MIKTSHVGSLPFLNTIEADSFNSLFDLPVLYTLPIMDSNQFMLEQVVGEYKEYSEHILETNITVFNLKSIHDFELFKYQMIGPITLIKSLKIFNKRDIDDLLDWYLKQLKSLFSRALSSRCYFFLDEPLLFMATDKDYILLNHFLSKLQSVFFKVGLHCCSEMQLKLINFDYIDGLSIESKYFESLDLELNFDLFLGVLDTKSAELDRAIKLSHLSGDVYVTPHCGLALTEISKMEMVSKNLTKWVNMTQAR